MEINNIYGLVLSVIILLLIVDEKKLKRLLKLLKTLRIKALIKYLFRR